MSWGRYDDKIRGNPKLRAIGKAARGALLMVWGYCAEQPTDGWVPQWVIEQEFTAAELKLVTSRLAHGRAPLLHSKGDDCSCLAVHNWTDEKGGYWVHDWLEYNPSKSENRVHRAKGKELKDKDLRYLVQRRDGNACRYCGVVVPWADKKSPLALTIDHVDPTLAAGASNLVVACTGCNSSKKDAITPEAAGLTMLPPPVGDVPKDGWPKGTDPASIERAWDLPPESIAPDHRPIGDQSPDPITDRSPIEPRSDTRSTGDQPTDVDHAITPARTTADRKIRTAVASGGATEDALPLGSGRDGSGGRLPPVPNAGDVGPAGYRPTVGPPTTPRSASSPPTYRKSATSNPGGPP